MAIASVTRIDFRKITTINVERFILLVNEERETQEEASSITDKPYNFEKISKLCKKLRELILLAKNFIDQLFEGELSKGTIYKYISGLEEERGIGISQRIVKPPPNR